MLGISLVSTFQRDMSILWPAVMQCYALLFHQAMVESYAASSKDTSLGFKERIFYALL